MFDPDAPESMEDYRRHLQAMSDQDLVREGEACARLCSSEANFGKPPREVFVVKLAEARVEWRRRHPSRP